MFPPLICFSSGWLIVSPEIKRIPWISRRLRPEIASGLFDFKAERKYVDQTFSHTAFYSRITEGPLMFLNHTLLRKERQILQLAEEGGDDYRQPPGMTLKQSRPSSPVSHQHTCQCSALNLSVQVQKLSEWCFCRANPVPWNNIWIILIETWTSEVFSFSLHNTVYISINLPGGLGGWTFVPLPAVISPM